MDLEAEKWKKRFEQADLERRELVDIVDAIVNGQVDTIRSNDGLLRLLDAKLIEENELLLVELTRSNKEFQDFAYAASHDLKTPLLHMEKFATFVLEDEGDKLSDKARGMQQQICDAAQRLGGMIESLLEYAKVDAKPLCLEAVNLNDVARHVLSDLAENIKNTGAQIEVSTLPIVSGEENQLYQVLLNVVGNALKYHRSGITPIIKMSSRPCNSTGKQEMSQIFVEDNGIGFDEAQVDFIFTSFKRLITTEEFSGSGIGLSTTLKIVKRHQGTISAKSTPGKGSTFIVTLPLAPVSVDQSTSAAPQRFLIVDDNPLDLQIILKMFDGLFHVFTANNAEEALSMLARENIDIVLSDYKMPDRDGIWLLGQVKVRFPSVRRFLCSSIKPTDPMNHDIIEHFFLKPIQVEKIQDSLRALENEKGNGAA